MLKRRGKNRLQREKQRARREAKSSKRNWGPGRIRSWREIAFDLFGVVPEGLSNRQRKKIPIFDLPGNFSIIHNPSDTQTAIADLLKLGYREFDEVFLNLRDIESVDAATVVVLFGTIRTVTSEREITVSGNLPADPQAKAVFDNAEFTKYMRTPRWKPQKTSGNVGIFLGITRGSYSKHWKGLVKFIAGSSRQETKFFADALAECIANIGHHAETTQWYACAVKGDESKPTQIAIYDTGVGIPATLMSTLVKLLSNVPLLSLLTLDSYELLRDATLGYRNHFGQEWRGKGLKRIREGVLEQPGWRLYVYSGKAMILWDRNGHHEIRVGRNCVPGTLICIEMDDQTASPHED